ncbi:MAG: class A sortase [Peptoniphilaceae bacterium]
MKKRKILAILFLLGGLVLLFLPYINKNLLENNSRKNREFVVREISKEEIQENVGRKVPEEKLFEFDSVENISQTKTFLDINKVNKNLVLGQIVIPSIDINLAILKGRTNNNLLAGATTMKDRQEMGKGNYAIAGHNTKSGVLFGNLSQIKKYDIVRISDKNSIFEYRVYKTEIVSPDRIDLISDKKSIELGKPILSLMNCYYVNGKNSGKRFFAFAELINSYPYSEGKMVEM